MKHKIFQVFHGGSDGKESTLVAGDLSLIPVSGGSTGGGQGFLLQYSCMENPESPWTEELGRL